MAYQLKRGEIKQIFLWLVEKIFESRTRARNHMHMSHVRYPLVSAASPVTHACDKSGHRASSQLINFWMLRASL